MWGIPVATYLFCGGLSAGLFIAAAVLQLAYGNRFMRAVRVGAAVSVVCLAIGVLFLLSSVGAPLRALCVFTSFENVLTSWMARGVWILIACAIVFFAYVVVTAAPWMNWGFDAMVRHRGIVLNVLGVVGTTFAVLLAAYTGLLLMDAHRVDAWNTLFVPALFIASAFETGFALMLAIFSSASDSAGFANGIVARRAVRMCGGAVVFLLTVAEAVLAVVYLLGLFGDGLDALAAVSAYASAAWPAIATFFIVLAASFVLTLCSFARRGDGGAIDWAVACCALVAGFSLRLAVLTLGTQMCTAHFLFPPFV